MIHRIAIPYLKAPSQNEFSSSCTLSAISPPCYHSFSTLSACFQDFFSILSSLSCSIFSFAESYLHIISLFLLWTPVLLVATNVAEVTMFLCHLPTFLFSPRSSYHTLSFTVEKNVSFSSSLVSSCPSALITHYRQKPNCVIQTQSNNTHLL